MDTYFSRHFVTLVGAFALLATITLHSPIARAQDSTNAGTLVVRGTVSVTMGELADELKEMDVDSVKQIGTNSALLRDVLENIYIRKSLALETSQRAESDDDIRRKLRIGQERQAAELALKSIDSELKQDADALLAYAKAVYRAEPGRFQTPSATRVQHILFRANNLDELCTAINKAKKLEQDLSTGASFETLARMHSEDERSAPNGGDLGFITPDVLVPALDRAIAKLEKPGDTSSLVQSEAGIHIIRLLERKPKQIKPFEEVKSALIDEAANKLKGSARQSFINKLLTNATYDEAAISLFLATRSIPKKQ